MIQLLQGGGRLGETGREGGREGEKRRRGREGEEKEGGSEGGIKGEGWEGGREEERKGERDITCAQFMSNGN